MARKREVVKIDGKEYCFKELTVIEIIELVSDNELFRAILKGDVEDSSETASTEPKAKENKGFLGDFSDIFSIFKKVAEKSADFKIEELKNLAPSEIRLLYDGFKKANSDFFFILEKLGIQEMLFNLKDQAVATFSKTLVT